MVTGLDKQKLEKIKTYAVQRHKAKEIALCKLESGIRGLVSEFVRIHKIQIQDVWIDDPETYLIHLEAEFSGPEYEKTASAMNALESEIQKRVGEYAEEYGVKILDVSLAERNNCRLCFETNL